MTQERNVHPSKNWLVQYLRLHEIQEFRQCKRHRPLQGEIYRKITTQQTENSLRIIQRSVTEIFPEKRSGLIQHYFRIFCQYEMGTGPRHRPVPV
jgi:hypothetical protein